MKNSGLSKLIGLGAMIAALAGPVKAPAETYFYGSISPFLNWDFSSMVSVQTVPEYIRQVPVHPDDYAAGKIYTIDDGALSSSNKTRIGAEGKLAIGIKSGRFDSKLGLVLESSARLTDNKSISSDTREKNYQGAGRTYGAALIYDSIVLGSPGWLHLVTPGIYIETLLFDNEEGPERGLFKDPLNKTPILAGGTLSYSVKLKEAYLENGWDRYDSLETRNTYNLADVLTHTIRFDGNFVMANGQPQYLGFYFGVSIPQLIYKTPLADETRLKLSPSFFIGIKSDIEFTF